MKRDIDFLFEIGALRHQPRQWRRFLGTDFASITEHHFRVFWIALIIAAAEKEVDTGKIAKLALLHDIGESRTGDVDYLTRQYVQRSEDAAMQDMFEATSLETEFIALWEEYRDRRTLE